LVQPPHRRGDLLPLYVNDVMRPLWAAERSPGPEPKIARHCHILMAQPPGRTRPRLRDGGAVPPRDAATDYPTKIRASGVDCRTARLIAREVTADLSGTPLNFDCPHALDDEPSKRCTKGALEVSWDLRAQ
jgi:hypothetical protein